MKMSPSAPPPLTTLQLVKMTGPVILFGILLPFVDNVTDLRMIIRLYLGLPICKDVDPEEYLTMNGTHWQDLYTCQQDPDTYCQLNPEHWGCVYFNSDGYPAYVPGCSQDYSDCFPDPVTFCEDRQDRPTCGHYKHPLFATMFLVPYLLSYFALFLHWYKHEKNRLSTLVFPIFNLYAVYDTVRIIKKIQEKPAASRKLKRDHYAQFGVMEVFLEATPSCLLFIVLSVFSSNKNRDDGLFDLFVGLSNREIALFVLSCGSSIFSSVFGVARFLLFGVCRNIKPSGPLDGLLGGRFLTAFAACLFTIVAKGTLISVIVVFGRTSVNEKTTLFLFVLLTPLCMALLSAIGFTKNSLKIIFFKPELIIMPTVTFFSYSKTKHHPCQQDCRVSFSPLFSIINIIISTICLASVLAYILSTISDAYAGAATDLILLCLVPHLLAVVFSLMVIFYDNICCCCCGCCLGAEERMVYDPNQPEAELVWGDGQIIDLEKSQDEREETEV